MLACCWLVLSLQPARWMMMPTEGSSNRMARDWRKAARAQQKDLCESTRLGDKRGRPQRCNRNKRTE